MRIILEGSVPWLAGAGTFLKSDSTTDGIFAVPRGDTAEALVGTGGSESV